MDAISIPEISHVIVNDEIRISREEVEDGGKKGNQQVRMAS